MPLISIRSALLEQIYMKFGIKIIPLEITPNLCLLTLKSVWTEFDGLITMIITFPHKNTAGKYVSTPARFVFRRHLFIISLRLLVS
jgi:hypothetical protein